MKEKFQHEHEVILRDSYNVQFGELQHSSIAAGGGTPAPFSPGLVAAHSEQFNGGSSVGKQPHRQSSGAGGHNDDDTSVVTMSSAAALMYNGSAQHILLYLVNSNNSNFKILFYVY